MSRWEYAVAEVPRAALAQTLNKLGAEGWELSVHLGTAQAGDAVYTLVFKKRVVDVKTERATRPVGSFHF